jgi:ribosomal protein S4
MLLKLEKYKKGIRRSKAAEGRKKKFNLPNTKTPVRYFTRPKNKRFKFRPKLFYRKPWNKEVVFFKKKSLAKYRVGQLRKYYRYLFKNYYNSFRIHIRSGLLYFKSLKEGSLKSKKISLVLNNKLPLRIGKGRFFSINTKRVFISVSKGLKFWSRFGLKKQKRKKFSLKRWKRKLYKFLLNKKRGKFISRAKMTKKSLNKRLYYQRKKILFFYKNMSIREFWRRGSTLKSKFLSTENRLLMMDYRLDVLLYRLGFSKSISNSKRLLNDRVISLNGRVGSKYWHKVKPTDFFGFVLNKRHFFRNYYLVKLGRSRIRNLSLSRVPNFIEFNFRLMLFKYIIGGFKKGFFVYPFNYNKKVLGKVGKYEI